MTGILENIIYKICMEDWTGSGMRCFDKNGLLIIVSTFIENIFITNFIVLIYESVFPAVCDKV